MSDVFLDQARFMQASEQTVGVENQSQYGLYLNLIEEEVQELRDSRTRHGDLDALIDILVVTIGAIHSIGADAQGAWDEVMATNMAKVDPVTGRVRKRKDGKVIKPDGWQPPDLTKYLK